MTTSQRLVLIVGALALALLGLFPPWREKADIPYKVHFEKALGYSFILSPPSSTLVSAREFSYLRDAPTIQIDLSRVFIQWIVLAAGAHVLCLSVGFRSQRE